MSGKHFRCKHRVSYGECTLGNHVYYARYLDMLEAARGEFFRSLGQTLLDLQLQGTIFPVIECRFRYKSPARYDDLLDIELWLSELGATRLSFEYRVFDQNSRLVADGTTIQVCTTLGEKPKRLPTDLKMLLEPYLRIDDGRRSIRAAHE